MAKFWFDGSVSGDNSAPDWATSPPPNVSFESTKTGLLIIDRRTSSLTFTPILNRLDVLATDYEILIKFRKFAPGSSSNNTNGLSVNFRSNEGGSYSFLVGCGTGYRNCVFRVFTTSNTDTSISSAFPSSGEVGVWRYMRISAQSSSIKLRCWDETISEPSNWTYQTTNSTHTSGGFRVSGPALATHGTEIGFISVGTDGDQAPSYDNFEVSGFITDQFSQPISTRVAVILRSSGQIIAETISDELDGSYTLYTPTSEEVVRVAFAPDGGLINDIIDRVIPG